MKNLESKYRQLTSLPIHPSRALLSLHCCWSACKVAEKLMKNTSTSWPLPLSWGQTAGGQIAPINSRAWGLSFLCSYFDERTCQSTCMGRAARCWHWYFHLVVSALHVQFSICHLLACSNLIVTLKQRPLEKLHLNKTNQSKAKGFCKIPQSTNCVKTPESSSRGGNIN